MNDDAKNKPDEYWKQKLTPEQYHLLREKGTEIPGTGTLLDENNDGDFVCAACGSIVFKSNDKYDSTTPGLIGWPSFSNANDEAVEITEDNRFGMKRLEAICKNCGSHLGHVFDDSSSDTGKHYCINSTCLDFKAKQTDSKS